MSQELLVKYSGGFLTTDTANSAGTAAVRDGSGGLAMVVATIAGLVNTGYFSSSGTTQTGTVTLTITSTFIQNLDATSAAFTTTLPAAAASTGLLFAFTKVDSSGNLPTIKGSGAEL